MNGAELVRRDVWYAVRASMLAQRAADTLAHADHPVRLCAERRASEYCDSCAPVILATWEV